MSKTIIPPFNSNDAIKQLKFIYPDETKSEWLIEVRVLMVGTVNVGFFDSKIKLIDEVVRFHGKQNIYVGLNKRIKEVFDKKYKNKIFASKKAGGTGDVQFSHNILIDIDPQRIGADGEKLKTPASDQEVIKAREVFEKCKRFLESKSVSETFQLFSGNGFHILIKIKPIHSSICKRTKLGRSQFRLSRDSGGSSYRISMAECNYLKLTQKRRQRSKKRSTKFKKNKVL